MIRERVDDVVVVGAGVVGATIAYELSHAGLPVRLIDVGAGPGAGCSYANAGLLSPSHVESMANLANVRLGLRHLLAARGPFRLSPRPSLAPWLAAFLAAARPRRADAATAHLRAMAQTSLALHHAYPDQGVATGISATGSLDVYSTQGGWAKARHGVAPERLLSAEQVQLEVPGLCDVAGGVIHHADAICNPLEYVKAMVDAARRAGAVVQWNLGVASMTTCAGRVNSLTLTDGETIKPRTVVLATGMGTTKLCAQLGVRVPLQAATGYVVDVPLNHAAPPRPITLKDAKVVLTPFADRLRAAGTLDLSGRAGAFKPHRLEAVRGAASAALPTVDWRNTMDTWGGDRPATSDGMPVIGTSRRVEGLVVATGHGMWGLILAPITAELVREGLIADPSLLTDPALSPDRFSWRQPPQARRPHGRRRPTPATNGL